MESTDPYVVRRLSIRERLLKSAGAGLFALLFIYRGISSNLETGMLGNLFWGLILGAGLGYWAFRLWTKREVRELATIEIPATPSSKRAAYLMFLLGVVFAVLSVVIMKDKGGDYIFAGFSLLIFLTIGGLMLRPEEVLTRAAREEQGRLSSVFTPPSDSSSPIDAASDAINNAFDTVWQAIVGIVVFVALLAVLIVPFFFAPWWAIVIIWLLILIAFK